MVGESRGCWRFRSQGETPKSHGRIEKRQLGLNAGETPRVKWDLKRKLNGRKLKGKTREKILLLVQSSHNRFVFVLAGGQFFFILFFGLGLHHVTVFLLASDGHSCQDIMMPVTFDPVQGQV